MSLEALAAEAGVSKGGLLYHFPRKHHLLRALVNDHVQRFQDEMERLAPDCFDQTQGAEQALIGARAYLQVMRARLRRTNAPASGIFAALAENPDLIVSLLALRDKVRELFLRCPWPDYALIVHLACEGLVHQRLTEPSRWDDIEVEARFATLGTMLGARGR